MKDYKPFMDQFLNSAEKMTIDELRVELEISLEHELFLIELHGSYSSEGQKASKKAEIFQAIIQRIDGDKTALNNI